MDPFTYNPQIEDELIEEDDDCDDFHGLDDYSDDAEALASAGWGTDEDYGYFGGGDDWQDVTVSQLS